MADDKPKRKKIADLTLIELYEKEKITPSVESAINQKEDFSKIQSSYCEKVCKLKCKAYEQVKLRHDEVDILLIQSHNALDGKWDRRPGMQEEVQRSIVEYIGKQAGFSGLRFRLVNLLKCPTNPEDFPNGKPPTQSKMAKCSPYLKEEIRRSKPKVIISLTTEATKALGLKKYSNTGNRGEIVDTEFGPVVISLHPKVLSMIRQNAKGKLWGQDLYNVIVRDFNKATRLIRGELKAPKMLEAIDFYVRERMIFAKSLEDVKAIMARIMALPANAIVSFDTETTGLDPFDAKAKLLMIQFGWRDPETKNIISAVIPLWHRENKMYDPDQAWNFVVPYLVGPGKKVTHNGKFDILYIACTTGIRVKNLVLDTMLLAHSIDSGTQGCYSLKTIAWDVLPDLEFAGWDGLLPNLTKQSDDEEEESEDEVEASVE
jgi:uracil-DNA glycosylase family 4